MIISRGTVDSPGQEISSFLEQFSNGQESRSGLCFAYTLPLTHLKSPASVHLAALYQASRRADGSIELLATVSDQGDGLIQLWDESDQDMEAICQGLGLPVIDLTAPLLLDTVSVAKPWGKEIWYTGCEDRGVSCIQGIPLPWVISLNPTGIMGAGSQTPLLLKILDPLPDPVYGDLYFEMHTRKRETYVITHVDSQAWPDGCGQIRYGFSAAMRASYPDDRDFKAAYLDCVRRYQVIRRKIDQQFDKFRVSENYALDEPVPVTILTAWQARLPVQWQQQEAALREEMNSFTGVRSLCRGDVISIPTHTPHALQHGVRAMEFQTPHYERQILSFAQKVLTQPEWDTQAALEAAQLGSEPDSVLEVIYATDGVTVESIARFDQFAALRITLDPDCTYEPELNCYALVIAVNGCCHWGSLKLLPEQACLVPLMSLERSISNNSNSAIQCLLAYPTT